jgi:hypothetical protein
MLRRRRHIVQAERAKETIKVGIVDPRALPEREEGEL